MYDRIDLTSVPGQDQIVASAVLDFADVFGEDDDEGGGEVGKEPEGLMRRGPAEVTPGHEPSAWPEGHFDPEPELVAVEPDEPEDEDDDSTDDDDETENLDDDEEPEDDDEEPEDD